MENFKESADWLGVLCGESDGTEIGDKLMSVRGGEPAAFMDDQDQEKLGETIKWGKASEQFLAELASNIRYAIASYDPKHKSEMEDVVRLLQKAATAGEEMSHQVKKAVEILENRDWA